MPIPHSGNPITTSTGRQSYKLAFILVTSLFFLWGIANSLNGTLVRHFQTALDLTLTQSSIVESAFYIGYFVMALPAAFIMNRIGYKKGIITGLALYALGALLFYPAAEMRTYSFFLFNLFMIACGLAFLETAGNAYVVALGSPSSADGRLNLAQSFNGVSLVLGPVIGGLFIFSDVEYTNEMLKAMPFDQSETIRIQEAQSVQLPYLVIAGVVTLVATMFALTRLPEMVVSGAGSIRSAFKHRHLVFGAVAQFFYVGAQVTLWGLFINLKLHYAPNEMFRVVDWIYPISSDSTPTQIASYHASFALILFMVGRFFGTYLMTRFAANRVLTYFALASVVLVLFAIMSDGWPAVLAISLVYFVIPSCSRLFSLWQHAVLGQIQKLVQAS